MRRGMIGIAALAAILLVALVVPPLRSGGSAPGAAQETDATPAGTPPAGDVTLEELQTRVAVLATEVALLGGVDLDLISGRLGGSRASFDADYGEPIGYLGPDQELVPTPPADDEPTAVVYDIPDTGRLAVEFAGDRAVRLVITPPDTDEADWTLDEANQVGSRFSPADATAGTLISDEAEPAAGVDLTVEASSEALATLFPEAGAGECPPVAASGAFTVSLAFTSAETVSALTYATGGAGGSLAPAEPTEPGAGRAERGGSAVANSSLGGTVTVNGIRVQAFQIRPNADGAVSPAAGQVLTAIDVAIENQTGHNVTFDLPDLVLVDAEGREVPAICGGVEPAITQAELAPGEAIAGWVTFQAPADFDPARFVFLVDSARIGFNLR